MKYYFFRDLYDLNVSDAAVEYLAHGYVEKFHHTKEAPSKNGKDMEVIFMDPYLFTQRKEWRSYSQVDLFSVMASDYLTSKLQHYILVQFNKRKESY